MLLEKEQEGDRNMELCGRDDAGVLGGGGLGPGSTYTIYVHTYREGGERGRSAIYDCR